MYRISKEYRGPGHLLNLGVFNTHMNYSASTKDVSNEYAFRMRFLSMCIWLRKISVSPWRFSYSNPQDWFWESCPCTPTYVYTYTYAYMCLIICTQINIHVYRDTIYIRLDLNSPSLFSETLQMVCQESCGGWELSMPWARGQLPPCF